MYARVSIHKKYSKTLKMVMRLFHNQHVTISFINIQGLQKRPLTLCDAAAYIQCASSRNFNCWRRANFLGYFLNANQNVGWYLPWTQFFCVVGSLVQHRMAQTKHCYVWTTMIMWKRNNDHDQLRWTLRRCNSFFLYSKKNV